jgi:hypothetical protein
MRRVALVLFLAFAATAFMAGAASANTVTPACNGGSCTGWFNASVSLHWDIESTPPAVVTDMTGCGDDSITAEGINARQCNVTWDSGDPPSANVPVDVKIDETPPVPALTSDRPPNANGWYTSPVTLSWSDALSGPNSCSPVVYSGPDTAGASLGGTCSDNAGNTSTPLPFTFNYDGTPPVVTGANASRPPDHNGWYNHPVGFSFTGTDATSGLAGCTSATYSGPVDSTAAVNGACTDNAGNIGLGSQSFKFDNTRPAAAQVQVTPGNHRIDVSWTLPNDASEVTVARSQQGSSAAPVVVYSGTRSSFLDKGLTNGVKYRYAVTDIDQAGNSSTKVVPAVPTASSLRPFVGTVVSSPPLLTWKKIKRARYYNVQLWFGRKKVLSTWPRRPSLQMKQSWHFRGKTYTLASGHYRWYVWPGFGPLSAHDYGNRIGRSSFRVVGS